RASLPFSSPPAPHPLALHSFPTRRSSDLHGQEQPSARLLGGRAQRREQARADDHGGGQERRRGPTQGTTQRLARWDFLAVRCHQDRKSTRLNSSHDQISYAVFCLKKKKKG